MDNQTCDEILGEFREYGIETMINEGVTTGSLVNEQEGLYWIRHLIVHFEGREEYEICAELNRMVTDYITKHNIVVENYLDDDEF